VVVAPTARPEPTTPPRLKQLVATVAVLLYVTGTFGSIVGPAWVDDRPALLLALNARNRNLFGSVPFIDPLAYSLIGFARVFVVGFVFFLVGRWWGDRFMTWTEQQLGVLPAIYRWFRTAIDRAGWLFVLLMPGSNIVCLSAGWRRMNIRLFVVLLAVGTVAKLAVLWVGGKVFEDQIKSFLDAISDYQWWLVGAFFAIWVIQTILQTRKSLRILAEREALAATAHDDASPVLDEPDA